MRAPLLDPYVYIYIYIDGWIKGLVRSKTQFWITVPKLREDFAGFWGATFESLQFSEEAPEHMNWEGEGVVGSKHGSKFFPQGISGFLETDSGTINRLFNKKSIYTPMSGISTYDCG